jgi:hypothetical protein
MPKSIFLLKSLLFLSLSLPALAQTITTGSLATSNVCAGTTLDVPFTVTGTFAANNTFTVQLANGPTAAFADVPGTTATLNGGTYTITATIPANATYGNAYRVRVVSSSPAVQGAASPTTLTIRTTPAAPALPLQATGPNSYQYTFCQNDRAITLADITGPIPANYTVQYDFGTGFAPTAQRTQTAPTINTATPSVAVYNLRFVATDATRGCNAPDREGFVAFLRTEVKLRPAEPFVPNTTLTYCQNSAAPAIAANANVPDATLVWFDGADKLLPGDAPTPSTSQTGTQTFQVAQSLNQCEGPKTRITVTVQTTPAPTVSQTRLEYCKDATAPALSATGVNLRWTTPTGTTSTAAPTPATTEVTKNANGDAYTVTQTGANGCTSPAATIRVSILGPPTAGLTGSTAITTGATATLSLTFTGNGPYRFRLSNGITGTATKDTTIRVSPTTTTVYQVSEVSNSCGVGLPTSSATITVAVPGVRTLPLSNSGVCAGSPITASYQTTGTFNTGNAFRLRIAPVVSGSAGTFIDLPNQTAGTGQVTATLPATLTAGTYALAVASTNPDAVAVNSFTATTILVRAPASATLSAMPNPALAGDLVRLTVTLGGDGPWAFNYRDSTTVLGAVQTVNTNANPHIIELRPQANTTYRLTSLSNGCGNAPVLPAPLSLTVNPLLATEPLADLVEVYPIPATGTLTVKLHDSLSAPATLELLDARGQPTQQQQTQQRITTMLLRQQAGGVYLLRVRVGEQTATRRVVIE